MFAEVLTNILLALMVVVFLLLIFLMTPLVIGFWYKPKEAKPTPPMKNTNMGFKPLTPSQQRRKNTAAGKGDFTDAELKAQVAAKRKATRQAKRALAQANTASANGPLEPTLKEKIESSK